MLTITMAADGGIYIPRKMLPVGGEWIMTFRENEIVLRPKLTPQEARRRMRELSDRLYQAHGLFPDSTPLIRADRDER